MLFEFGRMVMVQPGLQLSIGVLPHVAEQQSICSMNRKLEGNVAERQTLTLPFRLIYLKLLAKPQIEASGYFQLECIENR